MKTNSCVVNSAQLGPFKRLDAAFYVALGRVGARPDELALLMTKEEVLRRLASMKLSDLSSVIPITDGQSQDVRHACRKYPYIAYALVEQDLPRLSAARRNEAESVNTYATTLEGWMSDAHGISGD
jgi:hypothetical protein